jgi:hypothetical protein
MNPELQPHAIIHAEIVDDDSVKEWSSTKIALMNAILVIFLLTYVFVQYYVVRWSWANAALGMLVVAFYLALAYCPSKSISRKNPISSVSLVCAIISLITGALIWFFRIEL